MEILKIEFNNFRQFYGEQEIEFARGDKSITIIFGINGKGKTGIFRGLIFALYGSTHLPQDNKKDKIHLINWNALNEKSPNSASVTLTFTNNEAIYKIKRVIRGYKYNDEIIEEEESVQLYITKANGDISAEAITDRVEVKRIVDGILDEEVKDFFLFDGEKIDALAKTNSEVKKEVKTAIVNLLQIDKLEKAIRITNDLWNKENRRIRNSSSNIDINNKSNEKDEVEQAIKDIEEKCDLKEQNIRSCHEEVETIKEKLEENQEIRQLHERVRELNEKYANKKEILDNLQKFLKEVYFNQGHKLIMSDYYHKISHHLKQILVEQKDMIGIEIIEKSLRDMKCACCQTDLTQVKEALGAINGLYSNYKRSELTPLITKITSSISEFEMGRDEKVKGVEEKLRKIREVKNDLNEVEKKKEKIKEKVRKFSQNEEGLKIMEDSLQAKEQLLKALKQEKAILEGQLIEKNSLYRELEREYAELLRQNKETQQDAQRLEYIDNLREQLKTIFEEYSTDMREKLMHKSSEIFRKLIDGKDKDLINKIIINDKYELEIYNWQNQNATQDISQGQRQIVALAFITALAQIAGGDKKNIDFPLFMDTPFGRISGGNRDNLIENIPGLISQWILLLTDTEFSVQEEMNFKAGGKLGKWYRLEQVALGHTQIQTIDLNDTMAIRR